MRDEKLKRMFVNLLMRARTIALEIDDITTQELSERFKALSRLTYFTFDYAFDQMNWAREFLYDNSDSGERIDLLENFNNEFAPIYLKIEDRLIKKLVN